MERIDEEEEVEEVEVAVETEPDEGPDPGTRRPKANGAENPPVRRSRVSTASVIGDDERTQIHATNTYPYRAIASLLITAADGSPARGTGFFITPKTLVTAGHCVWRHDSEIPERNGQVQSIEVIPGRNGDDRPFSSVISTKFKAPTEWTERALDNHDYAVILLDTPLGAAVGTFGLGVYTTPQLNDVTANISGYPLGERSGTQWFHSKKLKEIMAFKVTYEIDTDDGQSGAPVWRILNRRRFAFAIHTGGGTSRNSGTRITAPVHANLTAWKV